MTYPRAASLAERLGDFGRPGHAPGRLVARPAPLQAGAALPARRSAIEAGASHSKVST